MKSHDLSSAWQLTLVVMLSVLLVMLPDFAFAQQGILSGTVSASRSPMDEAICIFSGWAAGNAGRALATTGIVILGIGASLGKISWGMAMVIGTGVAIIFGSIALMSGFGGSGSIYSGVAAGTALTAGNYCYG